jgi:hypothetical protein
MEIDEIGFDLLGHLFVRPVPTKTHFFQFVYRSGHGVRWNSDSGVSHAYEPDRWDAMRLYKQILADVRDELGENLL